MARIIPSDLTLEVQGAEGEWREIDGEAEAAGAPRWSVTDCFGCGREIREVRGHGDSRACPAVFCPGCGGTGKLTGMVRLEVRLTLAEAEALRGVADAICGTGFRPADGPTPGVAAMVKIQYELASCRSI